jgi:uncharacterized protein (DUF488 family)
MLNRQKSLLYMIEQANRPVTHLELTKWAFLLAEEMPSKGGTSFYDFLPYHYGPFSFTLFSEMKNLIRNGYIREVQLDGLDAWELVPDVKPNSDLPGTIESDSKRIVQRFKNTSSNDLLDYVYAEFPWYTQKSRIRKSAKGPVTKTSIYTIGYEKRSIECILNTLLHQGIQCLIDVRRNPVARRYGFHKSSLSNICEKVGIDYIHVPEVGIPSNMRQDLDSPAAYSRLFKHYERELLPLAENSVKQIAESVLRKPSALMCMEADPNMCHRTSVANEVASLTGLSINHIRERKCEAVLN